MVGLTIEATRLAVIARTRSKTVQVGRFWREFVTNLEREQSKRKKASTPSLV
jgi:hypothetical protein